MKKTEKVEMKIKNLIFFVLKKMLSRIFAILHTHA